MGSRRKTGFSDVMGDVVDKVQRTVVEELRGVQAGDFVQIVRAAIGELVDIVFADMVGQGVPVGEFEGLRVLDRGL